MTSTQKIDVYVDDEYTENSILILILILILVLLLILIY